MKVSEVGEFGLIDILAKMIYAARDNKSHAWQNLVLGIGDDAAAWRTDNSIQLATTDSLIEGIDFTFELVSWEELGWRAMAANLSDIAAMGGVPGYALISIGLPDNTEVEDVTALYRGMIELAKQSGVAIAGGDTSSAPLVFINITIIGSTGQNQVLTRSAAKPGDQIAVTGYLGASAAGLEMLTKHMKLDAEATAALKTAFAKPTPRIAEGRILVSQGVKSAIDISDGLIADLRHICQSSQVGARIEAPRVPIHPAVIANFGQRALELALSGGEDYELLFTARPEVMSKIKAATSCPITVIGEIIAGGKGQVILVDEKGRPVSLPKAGWEHFKSK